MCILHKLVVFILIINGNSYRALKFSKRRERFERSLNHKSDKYLILKLTQRKWWGFFVTFWWG